jgi:SAM-dependent methyltransferase
MPRSAGRRVFDFIFLPVRLVLAHDKVARLGLTSVLQERLNVCRAHAVGRALDVGAGEGNPFIVQYGNGVGCDILPQKGIDVVADAMRLPFADASFDTVLYIGSYLYFSDKTAALREARRVLRPHGIVLLTHINPMLIWLRHKTAWWDRRENVDYPRREALWHRTIIAQFESAGLVFQRRVRYLAGLSSLYVARKAA